MHALGMLNSGRDKTPLIGGGVIPLFLRCSLGTGSFDLQELYHSSGGQVLDFFWLACQHPAALGSMAGFNNTGSVCSPCMGGCMACRGGGSSCMGMLTVSHRRKKPGAMAGL